MEFNSTSFNEIVGLIVLVFGLEVVDVVVVVIVVEECNVVGEILLSFPILSPNLGGADTVSWLEMTVIDAVAIIRHNRPMNLIERLRRDWLIISLVLLMLADFRYSSTNQSRMLWEYLRYPIISLNYYCYYFFRLYFQMRTKHRPPRDRCYFARRIAYFLYFMLSH